ncbi:hypothetical protein [Rhodoferax saidenbachensis]|uniref:Outer membrane protein beta-barrel domain-containing protein n=1 Tax=Rhodoferax saidenbachensis TaxID=1484693 RepID=A0A1P8KCK2_9BURK|nr:hypothetical protein [Rhodoferax saidenbachensis]APW43695.1 hypothetical protein RS694_14900 [Rhodoferax saidenbachensis]
MKRTALAVGLALLLAGLAGTAQAAPMGFKDSWMTMGDLSPNWQEVLVNYALTPRDAIGASALKMRSDDETLTRDVAEVTYTHLVKRWNLPEAQANIWFIGGVGSVTGNDFAGAKTLAAPGIQVDYETTRVYASLYGRLYRAEGLNHDFAAARLGFSFYEVDYDETQPWFIVEVRRMKGLSDKTEVTPMLRLIHNRYFVELGVNNAQQARANFMYIF